jgi:hypothetical protein
MIDLSALFKRAGKVAAKNSPAILTAIGVTGTLSTAVLAAKGAFQASDILREAENTPEPEETVEGEPEKSEFVKKAELTWKCYIPAATCAALTVTAIICAQKINDRRTAAIASAYSVVEKSYAEYQAKTREKLGKTKEHNMRSEMAQDHINEDPPAQHMVVVTNQGGTLCKDGWSGQYFMSDMEAIRRAVNEFNHDLINDTYLSLAEFHHKLGIPTTISTERVGYESDRLLEIEPIGALREDGTPCIEIQYRTLPSERFSRLY